MPPLIAGQTIDYWESGIRDPLARARQHCFARDTHLDEKATARLLRLGLQDDGTRVPVAQEQAVAEREKKRVEIGGISPGAATRTCQCGKVFALQPGKLRHPRLCPTCRENNGGER